MNKKCPVCKTQVIKNKKNQIECTKCDKIAALSGNGIVMTLETFRSFYECKKQNLLIMIEI